MKKFVLVIILGIFILNFVFACDGIDINSASVSELDEIKWVGVSTAEKIIALRPFDCLDDLVRVSGISELRLEDIKNQGLACVEVDEESNEEDTQEDEQIEEVEIIEDEVVEQEIETKEKVEDKQVEVIDLTPQSIKTENNKESLDKTNYLKYGFVVFCALLGFLFVLKKKRYKTEFENN